MKRRFLTITLAVMMLSNVTIPSYAMDNLSNEKNVSVIDVNGEVYTVKDVYTNSYTIESEREGTTRVSIQNVGDSKTITRLNNEKTGESNYFVRDTNKGTFYSSITGKTVSLEDSINEKNLSNIGTQSNGDVYLGTKKISSTTIVNIAGASAGVAQMASAVIAYFGLPGAAAANISLFLTGAAVVAANSLVQKYPKGGIKFEVWNDERSSTKNGKKYYFYVKEVRNVGFYS